MTSKFSKIAECANDTPLETSMDSEKLSFPTVISSKEVPIFRFHVNHVKFQWVGLWVNRFNISDPMAMWRSPVDPALRTLKPTLASCWQDNA